MHHLKPLGEFRLELLSENAQFGSKLHVINIGKLINIGSDNGLSPGQRQAIIWTNFGISLIRPLGTNFSEIVIFRNSNILIEENAFENVVCEKDAILSRPQWVNELMKPRMS